MAEKEDRVGGSGADDAEKMEEERTWKKLSQGAEAIVYETVFKGKPVIVKRRPVKRYRHPALDKQLTKQRMNGEVRCLKRCRDAGISTPQVLYVDKKKSQFYMQKIEGESVKDFLLSARERLEKKEYENVSTIVAEKIGLLVAKMHNAKIIHGDLTTSNLMLPNGEKGNLFVIDFGLGSSNASDETKSVDLYVLERAFLSTHPDSANLFEDTLRAYASASAHWKTVGPRLEKVRMRGRKRTCFG